MATKPINELDFAAIKEQFIDHLRNQTQFKDYNFEGSNMNVLLDVLSYNTYMNNFYVNMAINEMFLDSAVIKNSVVSHAKELNYLPRSRTSAKAIVNITITDTIETASTITIPRFTEFTASFNGVNYNFITDKVHVARRTSGNIFIATNVDIYEGEILDGFDKDGFFIDEENALRCNLSNENIDISTIEVFVDEEATEGENQFFFTPDIFGVTPTSKVFYLDPYFDDRYSVYFGRNIYGEQPLPDIDIRIRYRACSGDEPNGANRFTTSFRPGVVVTTVEAASGGAERETLDSIKYFAPRSLQVQDRAVTARDYEVLLRQRFPDIQAVSVYGGDELEPPQYGKVAISINLQGSTTLSDTKKNDFLNFLSDKTPLSIEPIFVNPEFLFVETIVNVAWSRKQTGKSTSELEALIREAIVNYSTENLGEFGGTLRNSRLSALIDSLDDGIISNELCINPIIEYVPTLNLTLSPSFKFNSQLIKPYPYRPINGFNNFKPSITSTRFTYRGVSSLLNDDGNGNVNVVNSNISNRQLLTPNVGTVDYTTGEVRLINFAVESFIGNSIKIYAASLSKDISAPNNRILLIKDEDIDITFTEVL